jgi:hypothetical protein
MTVTRTHKAYMRGAIWLLALIGIILLPGFRDTAAPARVEISSR